MAVHFCDAITNRQPRVREVNVVDESSPLAWRESAAIADMHSRLAAKKLNVMMTKDGVDPDKLLSEIGKAIECLEAAHDAAMRAHEQLAHQAKRKQTVRGVRLTRVRDPASEPRPLKVAIGDAVGKSEQ